MNPNKNDLRVLHYGSIDVNIGGPAMSTYLSLKGLRDLWVDAQIAMLPLSPDGKLRAKKSVILCKYN